MLRYRVGSADGAAGLAAYYTTSDQVPEMKTRLAGYYVGAGADGEMSAPAIPQLDVHPAVQKGLGITPGRALSTKELANLLAGKRADGNDIEGASPSRNTFIDFTFVSPKDFSVVLALCGEKERNLLEVCYRDAVKFLMDHIASEIGTASVGRTAGNMATNRERAYIAMFPIEHHTARPTHDLPLNGDTKHLELLVAGDPYRHTHILVPMKAFTEEGRVTSLYQNGIQEKTLEWGAIGQAKLLTLLRERLGVDCGLNNTPGVPFEKALGRLFGIPQYVSEHFSKRHNNGLAVARDMARAQGLDYDTLSPEERVDLLDSGVGKTKLDKIKGLGEYEEWRRQAKEIGFNYRSVLRPDELKPMAPRGERLMKGVETSWKLLEEPFQKRAVIEGSMARVAAARSLIDVGIERPTDVNAITAAFRAHGIMQQGELTEIHWAHDPVARYARITTQKWLDIEREAIGIYARAALDTSVALPPEAVARAVARVEDEAKAAGETLDFSQGHGAKQREVAEKILASGRATAAIGVGGSGKSTLLKIPVSAWKEDGRDLWGVSLGWRQTEGLNDAGVAAPKAELDARNLVDAGLDRQRVFALTPFLNRLESGKIKLNARSVLVIDEIALIGTMDMLRLARLHARYGFQISGIGDDLQNQPIEAGSSIDLLRRSLGAENVPELKETIRQERDRDKETSLLFRAGDADTALRRKDEDGTLHIIPGGYHDAIKAGVDLWWSRCEANEGNPKYRIGISVPTNADGLAVGEEIRARLRALGRLGPDICTVKAIDQNRVEADLKLAVGDRVRLFDRIYGRDANNRNGIVGNNGTVVEVVGATENELTVKTPGGWVARVEWAQLQAGGERARLTLGYAISIDARQSETLSDHVTIMPSGSAAVNGFKAYVAESRHRKTSWIVTSQGAEKNEIVERRPIGDPRNNEADPVKVREAIIQNLARNLSRQPKKTLATEFMERAVNVRSGAVAALTSAWFYQATKTDQPRPAAKSLPRRTKRRADTAAHPARSPSPAPAPVQQANPTPSVSAESPPAETRSPNPTPQRQERPQMSPAEIQSEFANALQSIGLVLEGPPEMDGQKHQVKASGGKDGKPRPNAGIYTGHADGSRVSVGYNNRTGQVVKYRPIGVPQMSADERAARVEADRAARQAAEVAQQRKEATTADVAQRIWDGAKPAKADHPYLVAKDVDAEGLRQAARGQTAPFKDKDVPIDGRLLVPLRDIDGRLWNLQIIDSKGRKLFLEGRKKGLFFVAGELVDGQPKQIVEGVATAKTAYRLSLLTSVAAIDTSNLSRVGADLRAKFPDDALIYVTDNDHHLPLRDPPLPNAGVKYGQEAAETNRGVAVTPQFPAGDKGTDINDIYVGKGFAAARTALEHAYEAKGVRELLPPAPPPPPKRDAREVAWSKAKPQRSSRSTPHRQVPRENERPTHKPGV
jgi:phage/plasmid primase-like uncharacterized protein